MTQYSTRKRPLNLGLCLIATSVIAACGGASVDETTAAGPALELATEAPVSIQSATAASIEMALVRTDSVRAASDVGMLDAMGGAPVQADVGDFVDSTAGPSSSIRSVMPVTRAGPLSMGTNSVAPLAAAPVSSGSPATIARCLGMCRSGRACFDC